MQLDDEDMEFGEGIRNPALCDHPNTELRLRILSNKTTAVQRQCIVCGEAIGGAVKKTSITPDELLALPMFDNTLRETYRRMKSDHYREERARQREEWDRQSPARKAEYAAYLQTDHWKDVRIRVLRRDRHICQGCLNEPATQVHHLTYAHRGNELLFELTSLCDSCHERAHK